MYENVKSGYRFQIWGRVLFSELSIFYWCIDVFGNKKDKKKMFHVCSIKVNVANKHKCL